MKNVEKEIPREDRVRELFDCVVGHSSTRWRKAILDAAFNRALRDVLRAEVITKKQTKKRGPKV